MERTQVCKIFHARPEHRSMFLALRVCGYTKEERGLFGTSWKDEGFAPVVGLCQGKRN